jgi:RNA recognition motif-containing protein
MSASLWIDEDKENQENLPDNSNLQCNLCVTGLDDSITSEDLHKIFMRFGELKSCKVATDPSTGKNKGYGYVWYTNEKASSAALNAKDLPYKVQLYK